RFDRELVFAGRFLHERPGGGSLRSADNDRLRDPQGKHRVEIQVQRRFAKGKDGMIRIVGRAEQAALFGSRGQKHRRTFRPRLLTCPKPGHFQKDGTARRIVKGAVEDFVRTDSRFAGAEMVPVSGEDDRLRLEGRVAPFGYADDIPRDDLLDSGWDVSFDADAE